MAVTGNPRSQYVVHTLSALGTQPIYPVIRQDSSGVSEAFTDALALMDPLCAYVGAALTGAYQPSCQAWYVKEIVTVVRVYLAVIVRAFVAGKTRRWVTRRSAKALLATRSARSGTKAPATRRLSSRA